MPTVFVRNFRVSGIQQDLGEKADVSTHFLFRLLISLRFKALQIPDFRASSVMHLNNLEHLFSNIFSGFTQEGLSRVSGLHCCWKHTICYFLINSS